MANQFRVGNIVKLKSGGPAMTITNVYGDGELGCVWFVGTEQKGGTFPPDALEPVEQRRPQNQAPTRPYGATSDDWMAR